MEMPVPEPLKGIRDWLFRKVDGSPLIGPLFVQPAQFPALYNALGLPPAIETEDRLKE
jgi:hypothetical protein